MGLLVTLCSLLQAGKILLYYKDRTKGILIRFAAWGCFLVSDPCFSLKFLLFTHIYFTLGSSGIELSRHDCYSLPLSSREEKTTAQFSGKCFINKSTHARRNGAGVWVSGTFSRRTRPMITGSQVAKDKALPSTLNFAGGFPPRIHSH